MNIIDEEKVAHRLRQHLNAGTQQLDARVIDRLATSRQSAVAHHVTAHRNVTQANSISSLVAVSPWARLALMVTAVTALGIGITSTYYWNVSAEIHENAAIDSALLADDVPPNAYIDPGFQKWLERTSRSSAL